MTQDISSDLLNKNGVYKITNIIKDRFYIGSTSQGFLKRFKQHLYILKKGKSVQRYNQWMVRDYRLCDNFIFEVLEVVEEINKIQEREQYYLDLYFNKDNCYNMCPEANGVKGHKMSEESKKRISEAMKKRGNPQAMKIVLDTQTGIFYNSVKEVSDIFGYNKRVLANMLNPKQTNINRTNLKYV
jgi:group I intron endonuclease